MDEEREDVAREDPTDPARGREAPTPPHFHAPPPPPPFLDRIGPSPGEPTDQPTLPRFRPKIDTEPEFEPLHDLPTDPARTRVRQSPLAAPDEPTADDVASEAPTDKTGLAPSGFRNEKTAPGGVPTERWQGAPWLNAPDPMDRAKPRDPLFWPVVVFVAVMLGSIGVLLVTSSSPKPPPPGPELVP